MATLDFDELSIDEQMALLEKEAGSEMDLEAELEAMMADEQGTQGFDDLAALEGGEDYDFQMPDEEPSKGSIVLKPSKTEPKAKKASLGPEETEEKVVVKPAKKTPKKAAVAASPDVIEFRKQVLTRVFTLLKSGTSDFLVDNLSNAPPPASEPAKLRQFIAALGRSGLQMTHIHRLIHSPLNKPNTAKLPPKLDATTATLLAKHFLTLDTVPMMGMPTYRDSTKDMCGFRIAINQVFRFSKPVPVRQNIKKGLLMADSERTFVDMCNQVRMKQSKRDLETVDRADIDAFVHVGDVTYDEIGKARFAARQAKVEGLTDVSKDVKNGDFTEITEECYANELYHHLAKLYSRGRAFHVGTKSTSSFIRLTVTKKKAGILGLFNMCTKPDHIGVADFPLGILCHQPEVQLPIPLFADDDRRVITGYVNAIVTSKDGPIEGFLSEARQEIPRKLSIDEQAKVVTMKKLSFVNMMALWKWAGEVDEKGEGVPQIGDVDCFNAGKRKIQQIKAGKPEMVSEPTRAPPASHPTPSSKVPQPQPQVSKPQARQTPASPPANKPKPGSLEELWAKWLIPGRGSIIQGINSIELLEAAKSEFMEAQQARVVAALDARIGVLYNLIEEEQLTVETYVEVVKMNLETFEKGGLLAGPKGQKRREILENDIRTSQEE